jgi:hypothetical protein
MAILPPSKVKQLRDFLALPSGFLRKNGNNLESTNDVASASAVSQTFTEHESAIGAAQGTATQALGIANAAAPLSTLNAQIQAEEIARNAAIKKAIDDLIGGAPGAIDTFLEVAARFTSDEDVLTSLVNTVASRLTQAQADVLYRRLDAYIPATALADGSVSDAEFKYLKGATSPFQAQLNSVRTDLNNVSPALSIINRADFAYVVVDVANKIALGVRVDGTVDIGSLLDVGAKITANTALTAANKADILALKSVIDTGARSNLAWAIVDQTGQIALGVGTDGSVQIGATTDAGSAVAAAAALSSVVTTNWTTRSGIAWGVADGSGNLPLAIDTAGNVLVSGKNITAQAAQVIANSVSLALNQLALYGQRNISWWGDSITRGAGTGIAAPQQLATLLGYQSWNTQNPQPENSNLTLPYVYNGGYGSSTSREIIARQGGLNFVVTLQGDTIPASGAVAVTSVLPDVAHTANELSVIGVLNGVTGTLSAAAATISGVTSTTYTFTRLTAGAAVKCYKNSLFHSDERGRDGSGAFYAYQNTRDNDINIFWVGVNDPDKSLVVPAIQAGVRHLKAALPRFIVMGYLSAGGGSEGVGTAPYNTREAIDNQLRDLYPNNFLDIRRILVESYDPNNAQDVIDHNNDTVPTSLRSDIIHLNGAGKAIVAQAVYNFLVQKGWV